MKGIGVSPGISIGKAYVIKSNKAVSSGILLKNETAILADIERFDEAVKSAINEVALIKDNPDLKLHNEDIFRYPDRISIRSST